MVNALNAKGVETYADIVFNHMANEAWKRSDLNYPGSEVLQQYSSNQGYYNGITLFGDVSSGLFGGGDFHGTYDQGGPKCIVTTATWAMFSTIDYAAPRQILACPT